MPGTCCEISLDEIKTTVNNDVDNCNVEIIDYTIKSASDEPLGFLGDHVKIIVNIVDNSVDRQLQYFAKKIPTKMKAQREYAEGTRAFFKEIELYKTLFDDMDSATSPERHKFQWKPKCYLTRDHDLLIVEDLSLKGFYMLPERTLMALKYVRASIKVMARMHSKSIIFEEKYSAGLCKTHSPLAAFTQNGNKTSIRNLYPGLIFESECTDNPNHPGFTFWEVGIKGQAALIDHLPNYTSKQKEKIKKTFCQTIRQVYRMLEPSEKFRNVMIHADLWGNNLLFRDIPDDVGVEGIVVDFQMTRYAPPAQDLFMLLHIVQDREFRNNHEKELVDLYYSSLTDELNGEGLDVESLLPRKEFDESCIFYKRYAVLNQIIYTQLNITPAEINAKFLSTPEMYDRIMYEDRAPVLIECFKSDELCRTRVTEAMDEITEMFNLA